MNIALGMLLVGYLHPKSVEGVTKTSDDIMLYTP